MKIRGIQPKRTKEARRIKKKRNRMILRSILILVSLVSLGVILYKFL